MKKALVADDTKSIRSLLSTCLELEGMEVITAGDGEQALRLFKDEKPELAFLDIKMPRVSGTEVLREIRELGITTPVIIMTAFATVKNAVECTRLGAVAYLQKPFTSDKVKAVLAEVLGAENAKMQEYSMEDSIGQVEEKLEQGLYDEALELLKKTIAIDPSNARIYYLLGETYSRMGDRYKAQKFYSAYEAFTRE